MVSEQLSIKKGRQNVDYRNDDEVNNSSSSGKNNMISS